MIGLLYFWYLNSNKIDSLFSQLYGRLETERTEQTARGLDGKVSASVEVGGILAALGLAKINAGGEATKTASTVLEVTATLSPQNKVLVLMEYLQRAGQLATLDVDATSEASLLTALGSSRFQVLRGQFRPEGRPVRVIESSTQRCGAGSGRGPAAA